MKALFISDLHSNIDALEAIWQKEKFADKIYCAGDIVDVGPSPNEVIEWLKDHKAICIRGNHDDLLLQMYDEKLQELQSKNAGLIWLEHNVKNISQSSINYLRGLPETLFFTLDGFNYFMRHFYDEYEMVPSKFKLTLFLRSFGVAENTRLFLGHTHKQCIFRFSEQQIVINPGSTGYRSYLEPDDPNTEAEYAVVQDGEIRLCSVDYDKKRFRKTIEENKNLLIEKDYLKMLRRAADSRQI